MSKTTIPAGGITDSAVTTAKINADAITGAKLADNAINSEHYTDGSIDTAHVADSQITAAKTTGVAGYVLIKAITISGTTASVTFQNGVSDVIFDTTFDTYFITGNDIVPDNDDDNLRISFTDDTSSFSYNVNSSRVANGVTRSSGSVSQSNEISDSAGTQTILLGCGANGSEASNFYGYIFNPAQAGGRERFATFQSMVKVHNNNSTHTNHGILMHSVVHTGIRFNWNQGNFAQGTIRLYGLKNA